MYSQNIQPTKEQETRIHKLFTPEKIIKYSETISNEEKQALVIQSLESKIDSLKVIALSKNKVIESFRVELIKLNQDIRNITSSQLEVADERLDNAKKPFLGLHLKGGLVAQEFKLDSFNAFVDLTYELDTFSVGIRAWSQTDIINDTNSTRLYYGPLVTYKFF